VGDPLLHKILKTFLQERQKRQESGRKTGTTDHYKDAWFTGFTPTLCTSIWTGFDREKTLIDTNNVGITGGRSAAPIWAAFMEKALKSEPERDFPIPDNIRFEKVDAKTGCPAASEKHFWNIPLQSTETIEELEVPLKSEQHLCIKEEQEQP